MGVWIETIIDLENSNLPIVTPFVGVWIETSYRYFFFISLWSHPSWVCGLKQKMLRMAELIRESHPSWVCGLKPHQYSFANGALPSHPSWVCGLKQEKGEICVLWRYVTPFVGVWIETTLIGRERAQCCVTPFVGVWIETLQKSQENVNKSVTPFVGVWIETRYVQTASEKMSCHTLRGCVD